MIRVVPLTRLPDRALRPYESRVDSVESGLARPGRRVTNQVRTVLRRRIGDLLGRISAQEEQALDRALRIQLAL